MRGRPKKRIIDRRKLSEFLRNIRFEKAQIVQEWRHATAFGFYKNTKAVFKLASTQKTGRMTQNEYKWNELIHLISQNKHLNFTVPKNLASGFYEKLFYLITDKFENPLIERDSKNIARLASKIKQIAKAALEIRNLGIPHDSEFYKGQASKKEKSVGEKLLESASFWVRQVNKDLDDFLKIIEQAKEYLRASPGHGDFSPRQLYYMNSLIGIIDGEHAGIAGPLYYDPAWFYIRLRIDHDSIALAKEFLVEYKKLLERHDQDVFWEELKPVLVQRYIGELWGAGKNLKNRTDLEILGEDILKNRII